MQRAIEAAQGLAAEAAARAREALGPFPEGLSKRALLFATDFTLSRRY